LGAGGREFESRSPDHLSNHCPLSTAKDDNRRMPSKYWKNAFANRYESRLSIGDLEAVCGDPEDRAVADHCYFRVERNFRGNTTYEIGRSLLKTVPKGESWNFHDSNYMGVLWPSVTPDGTPIGMIAFHVIPRVNRRMKRIVGVLIDIELAYVHPKYRGWGYGRYLALGVISWIDSCRVNGSRAAKDGVEVILTGDFYSNGGERIFLIVQSQFELYVEMCDSEHRLPWRIREFSTGAGF
jgi:GNAT superfamily N-acetyltransferase